MSEHLHFVFGLILLSSVAQSKNNTLTHAHACRDNNPWICVETFE